MAIRPAMRGAEHSLRRERFAFGSQDAGRRLRTPDRGRRRGVAAVEFAVTAPLVLILLFGVWEVGRSIEVQQILSNAAREGGRQASSGLKTDSEIRQVVLDYVRNAGLPNANVTVQISNLTQPGATVMDADQLDQCQVTVTIPYADVRWVASSRFVASSALITAEFVWYSMNNKDYPSPANPAIE
jgi:Flp pilus assembly protein TadG